MTTMMAYNGQARGKLLSKQKIIIDCDPGHDDLVAILFAARHMDLVGVTTVHGNNTLENTTRNGLIALELGGLDVPLAAGCSEPLVQPSVGIAAGHGKSGRDGAAAAAVFESGIPLGMVGYNITRRTGFDESDINRMRASKRRAASAIAD